MKSIINELWHGNICPQTDSRNNSPEMKKNFDNLYEKLGGTYREKNGHLISDITLPEQSDYQIGKYGRIHLDYIKQHRRGRYTTLLTESKLNSRLHEIDLEAKEMLESIIPSLAAERGIDEDLKACDMLRWIAEMNNIKASAEEIVLKEVIYK